ncbi:DUF29 family protein [Candidatus Protochlamydia phocaeensis]|uniref:DUF29 family protein n=1 Tax=Candidatus Protochlamydia phocaeensis TaxID=1414722 RepID=UPI0009AE37E1
MHLVKSLFREITLQSHQKKIENFLKGSLSLSKELNEIHSSCYKWAKKQIEIERDFIAPEECLWKVEEFCHFLDLKPNNEN